MTSHLIESVKGFTKRIMLTKYNKTEDINDDELKMALDTLPANKQPVDKFRLNTRCYVLTMADESARNAALPIMKKTLNSMKLEVKAAAYLTKMQ